MSSEGSSLSQHYTDDWRDYYPTERDLYEITAHLNRYEIGSLHIINRRKIDHNRVSLFIIAKHRGIDLESKIYMDIISGAPTCQQFIDTTYNDGKNADYRIIIFDEHYSPCYDENGPGDSLVVSNLVENNNKHGVQTALVEVKGITSGEMKGFFYDVLEYPEDTVNKCELPDVKDVLMAEFWYCYYLPILGLRMPRYYYGMVFWVFTRSVCENRNQME